MAGRAPHFADHRPVVWCTEQYIVPAVLTARNLREARRGTMFAAYLKLAPVFIFLLPGMIAVALFKQGAPGFESIGENPQGAFPVLVSNLLPVGLRGLVLAGMLSALMSALASLFNSTATLFTVDFYKRLWPQSSEKHLVFVGRVATAVVILLGMAWIPFLQDLGKGQLYTYLQLVQSLLAPRCGIFLLEFSRGVTLTPASRDQRGVVSDDPLGCKPARDVRVEWPRPAAFVAHCLYFSVLLFVYGGLFRSQSRHQKLSRATAASLRVVTKGALRHAGDVGFWEIFKTGVGGWRSSPAISISFWYALGCP